MSSSLILQADTLEELIELGDRHLERTREQVERFRAKHEEDAAYAFAWADDDMTSAAWLEVDTQVVTRARFMADKGKRIDDLYRWLIAESLTRASSSESSTSQPQNIMRRKRLECLASHANAAFGILMSRSDA